MTCGERLIDGRTYMFTLADGPRLDKAESTTEVTFLPPRENLQGERPDVMVQLSVIEEELGPEVVVEVADQPIGMALRILSDGSLEALEAKLVQAVSRHTRAEGRVPVRNVGS